MCGDARVLFAGGPFHVALNAWRMLGRLFGPPFLNALIKRYWRCSMKAQLWCATVAFLTLLCEGDLERVCTGS